MRQSGKKKVNESADKTPARKTEPIYVQTGLNKNETKNDFSARWKLVINLILLDYVKQPLVFDCRLTLNLLSTMVEPVDTARVKT